MNRTAILAIGLLGFGLWAALWCVPAHVTKIEADILGRATEALAQAGVPVQVQVDGQSVALSGSVDSAQALVARDTVAALPGVTRVIDALTVSTAVTAADNATLRFEARLLAEEVALSGHVENDTQRARIVGHARLAFAPKPVIDRLSLRADVPEYFGPALTLGIEQLARLRSGRFTLTGDAAQLLGEAPNPTVRDSVSGALSTARLTPLTFAADLHLPPPTPARRDECQALFNRLLRGGTIRFATGSANISADSFPLLDRLAGAAKACADVFVEVQGHTDNRGNAEANQALSERRANAVRDYLLSDGVASEQLRARGYGATVALQSNATAAGRAANRRIELKALMPDEESNP